jgi:integrase/recombinase XerD
MFVAYLAQQNIDDLRKVTYEVIFEYQAKISVEPLARESRALKIRPIKRLFEYLTDFNKLLINPAEGIVETCRKNHRVGYVLTRDEIRRILDQPDLSSAVGIRNRAILEVMYTTGIRVNELVNIEISHTDFNEKILYVRKGKGRKQRVVPLGRSAAKYLEEYLVHIRPKQINKNANQNIMFVTQSGKSLTRGIVQAFVRRYRIAAGIKRPVSPHAFRRTCATHMLEQGADIRYIQQLLGHSRLSTTQLYTKIMPHDVKQTHMATHPNSMSAHEQLDN